MTTINEKPTSDDLALVEVLRRRPDRFPVLPQRPEKFVSHGPPPEEFARLADLGLIELNVYETARGYQDCYAMLIETDWSKRFDGVTAE